MKKIIFSLTLLFFALNLFSQVPATPTRSSEYYLNKSKKQKTTGWILLGVGTAAIVTGILIEAPHRGTGNSQSFTGGIVEVGGIIGTLTSIPFFISSSKNKKRATTLTVSNQRILQPRDNLIVLEPRPTISLKISLNRK